MAPFEPDPWPGKPTVKAMQDVLTRDRRKAPKQHKKRNRRHGRYRGR